MIKEAERQPVKRTKGYDPTETSKLFLIFLNVFKWAMDTFLKCLYSNFENV
jgi:hypothetical protein